MAYIRNIKELAALANVSAGTVSRALAGSELISKATRERIQAIADEHGFQPNVMARNLRTQRTGAIGVMIPQDRGNGDGLFDQFFVFMLGMIAAEIIERGFDMMLSRVDLSQHDWLDRVVHSGRADGFVVIGQGSQLLPLERVAEKYLPLISWGERAADQQHCSVGSDNHRGGYLAAEHLLARGCQRLAFFGALAFPEIAARHAGCRAAIDNSPSANELTFVPVRLTTAGAMQDICAFLDSNERMPDGIVAASDVIARGIIVALSDRGIRVPEDVKIVGYDGLPMSEFTIPRLTTISQNLGQGAALLVDRLCRRIAGEETESIILEPQLIVRQSS